MTPARQAVPFDPVEQGFDRGLVPVRPARGHPQAERPVGHGRSAAGEGGERGQDLPRLRAAEDVEVDGRRFGLERPGSKGGRSEVPGDAGAGVDKDAEAAARPKERHVLVRALARRAQGVDGPRDDLLPGLVEPSEFLAEPVDPLVRAEMERGRDRPRAVGTDSETQGGHVRAPQPVDVAGAVGEDGQPFVVEKPQAERIKADLERHLRAGDDEPSVLPRLC